MKKKMKEGGMAGHLETAHSIPKASQAYKKGGPTSLDRKNLGRNMSRVKNQRGR